MTELSFKEKFTTTFITLIVLIIIFGTTILIFKPKQSYGQVCSNVGGFTIQTKWGRTCIDSKVIIEIQDD